MLNANKNDFFSSNVIIKNSKLKQSLNGSLKMPFCKLKTLAAVLAEALASLYTLIWISVKPHAKRLWLYLMEYFLRKARHGICCFSSKTSVFWTLRCKMAEFKRCLWQIERSSLRLYGSFLPGWDLRTYVWCTSKLRKTWIIWSVLWCTMTSLKKKIYAPCFKVSRREACRGQEKGSFDPQHLPAIDMM